MIVAVTTPKIVKITLLVLRCKDVELSRTFYEAMGLQFTPEQHGSGPRHYATQIAGVVIELYPQSGRDSSGVRLGFEVPDLCATLAAVRAVGGSVLRFSEDAQPPSALVADPDGHKIDLTQTPRKPVLNL